VLDAIALAGGFTEYADRDKVVIIRKENGQQKILPFNYKGVTSGRTTLIQNIELKPGDTVVVP